MLSLNNTDPFRCQVLNQLIYEVRPSPPPPENVQVFKNGGGCNCSRSRKGLSQKDFSWLEMNACKFLSSSAYGLNYVCCLGHFTTRLRAPDLQHRGQKWQRQLLFEAFLSRSRKASGPGHGGKTPASCYCLLLFTPPLSKCQVLGPKSQQVTWAGRSSVDQSWLSKTGNLVASISKRLSLLRVGGRSWSVFFEDRLKIATKDWTRHKNINSMCLNSELPQSYKKRQVGIWFHQIEMKRKGKECGKHTPSSSSLHPSAALFLEICFPGSI